MDVKRGDRINNKIQLTPFGERQNEKKESRVGIYCRVSTREQAEGFSIQSQQSKIDKYLDYHEDVHEVEITREYYIDEGFSAKDLNRKGMKRLIQDINDKKLDMVVIYKLDRMSRNVLNTYELLALLVEMDCALIAVMDRLDIYSANGRMLIGVLAIIAQWERETIAERTKDGLLEMVTEGYFPYGYTPFGYTKINRKLFYNENEQRVYKRMVNLALSGVTCKEIEDTIWIEFKLKKRADVIRKLLDRKYYCGIFEYEGKLYRNIVPPTITEDEFEMVQRTLKKRRSAITNGNYYFGNAVRCSCGEICSCKLTKKPTKRIYYYYCANCNKRINQNDLVNAILYQLMAHAKIIEFNKEEKKLMDLLRNINKKMSNTYDQYKKDMISAKLYAITLTKLEQSQELLLSKLNSLQIKTVQKWFLSSDLEKKEFISLHLSYLIVDTEMKIVNKIVLK